jgi:2-polyprenyl-3-methyl-5-hydroxy-6-metoxy-1,4-benzoquinol methylase
MLPCPIGCDRKQGQARASTFSIKPQAGQPSPMKRYEPKVTVNDPCVICGSSDSTPLFATEFPKYDYKSQFFMRTCRGCGLRFASPRLADRDIASLYDESYYIFSRSDDYYLARTADIYGRTIGIFDLKPGLPRRVAEVGSGKGYLLAVLERLGWHSLGIELSPSAAGHARTAFGVETFTGTTGDYFSTDAEKDTFSVVLCIDVIEHVTDPEAFVRDLARLTAAGGTVMIDTPNGAAWHIDIEGVGWRGFNPFHIYLFNAGNLTKLLERHGFKVTQIFTYNNVKKRPNRSLSYFRLLAARAFPGKPLPLAELLDKCIDACKACKGYWKTEDARGELAAGCRGENLVVFAERL